MKRKRTFKAGASGSGQSCFLDGLGLGPKSLAHHLWAFSSASKLAQKVHQAIFSSTCIAQNTTYYGLYSTLQLIGLKYFITQACLKAHFRYTLYLLVLLVTWNKKLIYTSSTKLLVACSMNFLKTARLLSISLILKDGS